MVKRHYVFQTAAKEPIYGSRKKEKASLDFLGIAEICTQIWLEWKRHASSRLRPEVEPLVNLS